MTTGQLRFSTVSVPRNGPEPGDRTLFLREFVRQPMRTASVTPSSAWLAVPMVAPIPERGNPLVVELGPGTGAFTSVIQQRLAGRGRHLAVEMNVRLAARLAHRFPEVEVLCADAAALPELLDEHGVGPADVIISGLPWVALRGSRSLATAVAAGLRADGAFTQFTYAWTRWSPPARRQQADLRTAFEEVVVSRTVWRNAPPACVYVARRPRTGRPDA